MPNTSQIADFFNQSGLNPQDPHWQEMLRNSAHVPDPRLVRSLLSLLFSSKFSAFGKDVPDDQKALRMLEFYMEANDESFKKLAE